MSRTCIICGKDISHLRANAVVCGCRSCDNRRTLLLKNTKNVPRYCEICGSDISDLPRLRRICKNDECIKALKIKKNIILH